MFLSHKKATFFLPVFIAFTLLKTAYFLDIKNAKAYNI